MASIKRSLSTRVDSAGYSEILLRVIVNRNQIYRIKSGVYVKPEWFTKDGTIATPKGRRAIGTDTNEISLIQERLLNVERVLMKSVQDNPSDMLSKDSLQSLTSLKYKKDRESLDDILHLYFEKANPAASTRRQMTGVFRMVKRWELWRRQRGGNPFFIADANTLTADDLDNLLDYLEREPMMYQQDPTFFRQLNIDAGGSPSAPAPKPRGVNFLHMVMKKVRCVINWYHNNGYTTNDPFKHFTRMPKEIYGTPYYLTKEELNKIAEHDFSIRSGLETQRDIFIFQCLVGCRIGDLKRFTTANILSGFLEYMPTKTKHSSRAMVRVPLTARAKSILDKYANSTCRPMLFPFISDQKYNDAIKRILLSCGIDRYVTILNPITGKEESHPLYEVGSSHMARRTFIGNLYKKIKDPNIIAAMSGHNEGSKAFARYREIDDDIKLETVNLLED